MIENYLGFPAGISGSERRCREAVALAERHGWGTEPVIAPPLAAQARLGMTREARAGLAALDDERATSGEIGNARATICLADGDPAAALAALRDVLDGTAQGTLFILPSRCPRWPSMDG